MKRKTWDEFRKSGMLWFINRTLHVFGWSLVINKDDEGNIEVFPARVTFRGFSRESEELLKEVEEEDN